MNLISSAFVRRRKETGSSPARHAKDTPLPPTRTDPSALNLANPEHLHRPYTKKKGSWPFPSLATPRTCHYPHTHRSARPQPRLPSAPPFATSSSLIAHPPVATTKKNYFNIEKHLMQQMKKIWCNNNKKLLLQTKKSYCNIKITSNATTKKYELQHKKCLLQH